jgi:ATP-binding cassette subfamily C (CFTR/MRP) protein 4
MGAFPAVGGVSVVVLLLPIQILFGRRFAKQRRRTAKYTELRVRTVAEAISGIVTTKAACWEAEVAGKVKAERAKERQSIFISASMKSFNLAAYFASPYLSALATFLTAWAGGTTFGVGSVFSALSLIHVLRMSIGKHFTRAIETGPECAVAVSRMRNFLLRTEVSRADQDPADDGERDGERAGRRQRGRGGGGGGGVGGVGGMGGVEGEAANGGGKPTGEPTREGATGTTKTTNANTTNTAILPGAPHTAPNAAPKAAISFDKASFSWTTTAPVTLSDISLSAIPGDLVIILGPCGSGKSSLLNAMLGELVCHAGRWDVDSSIDDAGGSLGGGVAAYAAQASCVMPGSVRSNVCFGLPFEAEWFDRVLSACALDKDIAQLADGADTEIGERGVNLSGGQKARVSLARAVYSRSPICLLDDPLSAVDPPVGQHIFHQCVQGLIREEAGVGGAPRTVVLVTHHEAYAEYADVVVRLEGGKVASCQRQGPGHKRHRRERERERAMGAVQKAEQKAEQKAGQMVVEKAVESKEGAATPNEKKKKKGSLTKLVHTEERNVGDVSWRTYVAYFRHGGFFSSLFVLFLFAGGQGIAMAADWWLKLWSEASLEEQRDPSKFLYAFLALSIATTAIAVLRAVIFFAVGLRSATNLHRRALWGVLRSPWRFFTANPLGRIVNKFSADQDNMDELLPICLFDTIQIGFLVLGSLVLCVVAVPYVLILLIPLLVLFVLLRRHFLHSSRELKRLESITKSPVCSMFASSAYGLVTVRAFGAQDRLQGRFVGKLDTNGRAWFSWLIANRWIGFRLDMLSWVVLAAISIGATQFYAWVEPGLAGIAIVYSLSLSGFFQYMVRQSAQVETYMTSVERLLHYCDLPSEGAIEDAPITRMRTSKGAVVQPSDGAGKGRGAIELVNTSVRYGKELPVVLRGASLRIEAGQKVGVVGRSGSGKSSMIMALLRLNEVCGGRIEIDGEDTAEMDLHRLRRQVALIPQEPHLVRGTLRDNLDPFGRFDDAAVWGAVDGVQLSAMVRGHPDLLLAPVADGGQNFSAGERQLLSLARALLQRAPIILMDEATANVDMETDRLIQEALRRGDAFKESTVLIVAHRLATVADCDRVIVVDAGTVLEMGDPAVLLRTEGSAFRALAGRAASALIRGGGGVSGGGSGNGRGSGSESGGVGEVGETVGEVDGEMDGDGDAAENTGGALVVSNEVVGEEEIDVTV